MPFHPDPERLKRLFERRASLEELAGCFAAALFFVTAGVLLAGHVGGQVPPNVSMETTASIGLPLEGEADCITFDGSDRLARFAAPRCHRH